MRARRWDYRQTAVAGYKDMDENKDLISISHKTYGGTLYWRRCCCYKQNPGIEQWEQGCVRRNAPIWKHTQEMRLNCRGNSVMMAGSAEGWHWKLMGCLWRKARGFEWGDEDWTWQ
jgi:hypothetical protein